MKPKIWIMPLFLLVLILLAACRPAAGLPGTGATSLPEETAAEVSSIPTIEIDAEDYSYTSPATLSAGWVRIAMTNTGAEDHLVQFLRLNEDVTFDQFQEALQQGKEPALALVSFEGGVGAVAPGGSGQVILNLPAGEYVILCPIPSPQDQIPHYAKGMIMPLTVQPASGPPSAEPEADLTVTLRDFEFEMPETLPAGPVTIQVTNEGPEPHEFNILRLEEGRTAEDVLEFINGAVAGPPPFTSVGGMNGLGVGSTGYLEYDFEPGTYVAICFIPSPDNQGQPHVALGMIRQFMVASP